MSNKHKLGERVRIAETNIEEYAGDMGTITEIDMHYEYPYRVKPDSWLGDDPDNPDDPDGIWSKVEPVEPDLQHRVNRFVYYAVVVAVLAVIWIWGR